ncbi:Ku protein [Bacillaceae bacterium IKA-2]|nr:Ku protein [Bacillaceae bacterium IKA-2]
MHTMWKGSISFGLVHIPIKLYSATENKDIKLRMIHKECNSPIKYERTCPVCNKEVENNEIVKGYEYEPGKFVLLDAEDFEKLEQEQTKSVEIIDFVKLAEIDPIYYNRSYFIGPNENGQKAYTLLKQAMEQSGKIGVAKITIRSKQHLAVVRVYKTALVLETIFFPDEVRNVDQVPSIPETLELSKREMDTAIQLIEQLTTPFEPEKYTDDYRNALTELIQGKITGNEVKVTKDASQTNVLDLMDALQASVDQTKPKKRKTTRKKKATG